MEGGFSLLLFSAIMLIHLLPRASAIASEEVGVPAYVWSDHRCLSSEDHGADSLDGTPGSVAVKFLQRYVGTESKCADSTVAEADTAVIFIGNELRFSDDLPASSEGSFDLQQVLKDSGLAAGYSVEVESVSSSDRGESITDMLLSKIVSHSIQDLGDVATVGACEVQATEIKSVDFAGLEEYLLERKETGRRSTDLLIVCTNSGKVVEETLLALQSSGTSYTALYVNEEMRKTALRSRSLSEASYGTTNETGNVTTVCNALCQKRALLWESFFVFLIMLIILISGTCCMVGVNTPTRFEASKEA